MVSFAPVRFIVNGKDVTPSNNVYYDGKMYVPTAFHYAGTIYVPLQFITTITNFPMRYNKLTDTVAIGNGVATTDNYLSNLPWKLTSEHFIWAGQNAWFAVENNNNTGPNGIPLFQNWNGMTMQGTTYHKGIAIGAAITPSGSEWGIIAWYLHGYFSHFQAILGYDDQNNCRGISNIVSFIGNGRTLYSTSLTRNNNPTSVDFSVQGISVLFVRVYVNSACGQDIIDIANPVLTRLYQ